MPARSEWKGFLCVNQLRVPVKAFSSSRSTPDITLNQLHRDCGERIQQQKTCPRHGRVEADAIIPGYQVAEHCYLALDPAELEELRPEADKAISVACFIDSQEIDPVFHSGRTLYLVPDSPLGQRSFGVLRDGMKASGRHAFSRIVMSRRELLVLLRPYGKLLAMTVIEYHHRVRDSSDYESEVASLTPSSAELELIQQLIDAMTDQTFDLSRYHDHYMDRLNALIEQKVAAADLTSTTPFQTQELPAATEDEALLAILKSSLNAAGVTEIAGLTGNQRFSDYPLEHRQNSQKLA